ncbi:MAG: antitoxin Xre/MbcA/ParS toxin-binding domain-containing protein [Pseudomonas sp.]
MSEITRYWESEAQKTFRVVEAMAVATVVFGDRDAAARWMQLPALGLNGQKPIELVLSPDGLKKVLVFLERLKYGVYC